MNIDEACSEDAVYLKGLTTCWNIKKGQFSRAPSSWVRQPKLTYRLSKRYNLSMPRGHKGNL